MYGDYVGEPRDREKEILRFELDEARALLSRCTDALERQTVAMKALVGEADAAKRVAQTNLIAVNEAQAEISTLREAVRQLTADVAHYAAYGPEVPAWPKPMVTSGEG